jgi:hypothetical protein
MVLNRRRLEASKRSGLAGECSERLPDYFHGSELFYPSMFQLAKHIIEQRTVSAPDFLKFHADTQVVDEITNLHLERKTYFA